MDFWDVFIELEHYSNEKILTAIQEKVNWLKTKEENTITIYDDFVNLNEVTETELRAILILFYSLDKIEGKIDLKTNLPGWLLVYLLKFYYFVFEDLGKVSINLNNLCGAKLCSVTVSDTTQYNFDKAKEIYSNFEKIDTSNIDFKKLDEKILIIYNNKIFIVYTKEDTNDC